MNTKVSGDKKVLGSLNFQGVPKLGQGPESAIVPQILTQVPLLNWNRKRVGARNGGVEGLQFKKSTEMQIRLFPYTN